MRIAWPFLRLMSWQQLHFFHRSGDCRSQWGRTFAALFRQKYAVPCPPPVHATAVEQRWTGMAGCLYACRLTDFLLWASCRSNMTFSTGVSSPPVNSGQDSPGRGESGRPLIGKGPPAGRWAQQLHVSSRRAQRQQHHLEGCHGATPARGRRPLSRSRRCERSKHKPDRHPKRSAANCRFTVAVLLSQGPKCVCS